MKCTESILIYGPSGAGKTTQAEELAKFLHPKKVRLISASGGGWSSINASVELGMVEPLWLPDYPYPFEALFRLSQGWWPLNGKLAPPSQQQDWDQVGGLFFEGLKEISDLLMRNAVIREASGEIQISQQKMAISFRDGDTKFGGPSLAHFGVVQNMIEESVAVSKSLEGKYVVWTSLELKASDDNTRMPLYGPDVIGKAKTSVAPAWFDDCLHIHFIQSAGKPAVRRMYLQTHFEADGIPYAAKNRGHRLAPLPEYLEGADLSLGVFLSKIKESHEKAKRILKEGVK